MEARPHKRKLLRGSATHSTISMGQVGLAFSRRQQCLFKIKIGTFKDIKVCSSQGMKRRKFPDVILTDRQKTDYFRTSLVPRPFYARGARWERDKGLVPVVRACVKFYWNPGKIVLTLCGLIT